MRLRFGDFTIETARYELHRKGAPVPVEPQVFELLAHLIAHRDRVVSQQELFDAVWDGRFVSQSALTTRINAARTAIGDSGRDQILIKTLPRKGYRFTGEVTIEEGQILPAGPLVTGKRPVLHQQIRFRRSPQGIRLAYAQSGKGPPLVKAANWMSHLELDWQSPVWGHWLHALSANHHLTRYDGRGNGLSDRDVPDVSLAAMVSDLEAVVDETQQGSFALLGIGQGASVAIAYAVRHPERVTRLVLYGGYIKGWRARGDLAEIAWRSALGTLIREGWGLDSVAFRQVFTSLFLPDGHPEQMEWYNELQRTAVEPRTALRLHESFGDFDVSELVSKIRVPTLVMHARGDLICPFSAGRALSIGIPGARLFSLESKNHILMEDELAFTQLMTELNGFLNR
jgi:DNA-binding winged helix-turn-helix (wHTH) protein/alpha-beta hydrolase superfamily lysophospholipase